MPKSIIITKRITMTETAWTALREIVDDAYNECVTFGGEERCRLDISDAQTALAEADVIAETVNPAEEPNEIDAWVIDALNEGRDV